MKIFILGVLVSVFTFAASVERVHVHSFEKDVNLDELTDPIYKKYKRLKPIASETESLPHPSLIAKAIQESGLEKKNEQELDEFDRKFKLPTVKIKDRKRIIKN